PQGGEPGQLHLWAQDLIKELRKGDYLKNVNGTTTNDNAGTGDVGEIIESSVAPGSGVSLTTGVSANVTTISLTPGDWDAWGTMSFSPAVTTTMTELSGCVHSVSATFPTRPGSGAYVDLVLPFTTGNPQTFPLGKRRFSLATTTTLYLVAFA